MTGPRILLPDVEVAFKLGYFYNQWNTNIPAHRIKQDSFLISAAWKWYGQKTIHSVSVLDDPTAFKTDFKNDRVVANALYEAYEEADAVVYFNGINFDDREINTALIRNRIPPKKTVVKIDPYKIARSHFRFSGGNSLKNLCVQLKLKSKKADIDDETWIAAAEGCPVAIKKVVSYNRHDIEPMSEAWDLLKPYAPAALNMNHFVKDSNGLPVHVCPSCGSANFTKRGKQYNKVMVKQTYHCQDCGHRFVQKKSVGSADMR